MISHVIGSLYKQNLPALLSQRQRLIESSKNQRDGEAGPGSRGGSTSNSLKRTGSCSLENGGKGPGIGDAESGDKPGVEVCQPEEEDDDDDGIFSPVRIPGEEDFNSFFSLIDPLVNNLSTGFLFMLATSCWKPCLM